MVPFKTQWQPDKPRGFPNILAATNGHGVCYHGMGPVQGNTLSRQRMAAAQLPGKLLSHICNISKDDEGV